MILMVMEFVIVVMYVQCFNDNIDNDLDGTADGCDISVHLTLIMIQMAMEYVVMLIHVPVWMIT